MLVGNSIALCIKRIIDATVLNVNIDELVIISGTRFFNRNDVEKAIQIYKEKCWNSAPELGGKVCRHLFEIGHVIQPRTLLSDKCEIPYCSGDFFDSLHSYYLDQQKAGCRDVMKQLFPNGPDEKRLNELMAKSIIS